jgi:cobalt-zinc-cadmium efflux system membrane fusion protein
VTARAVLAALALAAAGSSAGCSRSAPAAAPPEAQRGSPPAAADPHAGHDHGPGVAHAADPAAGGDHAAAPALCSHRVPAELCTRCNPDLVPVFREQGDWCAEHGVPESQCLACNPGLTFAAAAPEDWCKEHAVPESSCTRCNPRLVARFVAAGDYCREHGYPESLCPICHPERVPAGKEPPAFPTPGLRVRLASAQTGRDAGIETRPAQPGRIARTLEVVGQLDFDRNRLAQLSARAEALVVSVPVDVGDEVKPGQPVVVLTSAAIGAEQGRLHAARARLDAAASALAREEQLAGSGLSPQRSLDEARRELAAAQAEHDAARAALGAAGAAPEGGGGRHVLRAPFAGTVVARDAVAGRTAAAGQVLVEVADLSTMWAQLEVPEADAALVRPGQPVRIVLEGTRAEPREARISRVAPAVDPASRTVKARVELPNGDRSLKAGLFLRAEIRVTADRDALLVPREALQRAEGRTLVFVRRGEGLFEPVAVRTGEAAGELVEVVSGLEPRAEVVTAGAFLLKTEIMKDSIGAGCCDLEEK